MLYSPAAAATVPSLTQSNHSVNAKKDRRIPILARRRFFGIRKVNGFPTRSEPKVKAANARLDTSPDHFSSHRVKVVRGQQTDQREAAKVGDLEHLEGLSEPPRLSLR